jgi:hypothetical protein
MGLVAQAILGLLEARQDDRADARPGFGVAADLGQNPLVVRNAPVPKPQFVKEVSVDSLLLRSHVGIRSALAPAVDPPPSGSH